MIARTCVVLGIAATLFGLAVLATGTAHADDKDKMQGTWKVVKAVAGIEKADKDLKDEMHIVIEGRKFTLTIGDHKEIAHLVLDTEGKLHTIDFFEKEDNKKKVWHGVYEFDGKDLKLCWGSAGDKRPNEFGVRKDSEDRYYILRKK